MPKKSLIVALTGGIGSGKSTVANLFAELGVPVIDSDVISRELTQPHTEITRKIIDHFGDEYAVNGELDRKKLKNQIFRSEKDKKWLENLLHPAIYAIIKSQIAAQTAPYVLIVIPLLIETGIPDFIDSVLVVDTLEELQIKRVIERDMLNTEQVNAIINAQVKREKRIKKANDVIVNNHNIEDLKKQVLELDRKYRGN